MKRSKVGSAGKHIEHSARQLSTPKASSVRQPSAGADAAAEKMQDLRRAGRQGLRAARVRQVLRFGLSGRLGMACTAAVPARAHGRDVRVLSEGWEVCGEERDGKGGEEAADGSTAALRTLGARFSAGSSREDPGTVS